MLKIVNKLHVFVVAVIIKMPDSGTTAYPSVKPLKPSKLTYTQGHYILRGEALPCSICHKWTRVRVYIPDGATPSIQVELVRKAEREQVFCKSCKKS